MSGSATVWARIRHWIEVLRAHGLTIEEVEHKRHIKFRLTDGRLLVMSKTPTDHRGDLNTLARIKRMSELPPTEKPEKAPRKPKERRRHTGASPVTQASRPPPLSGWKPGTGHPEANRCPTARARLGLDGRRTPQALVRLGRPTLSLPRKPAEPEHGEP